MKPLKKSIQSKHHPPEKRQRRKSIKQRFEDKEKVSSLSFGKEK